AALAMLAPVATPPPEPPAKPKAKVRETEGKTAARDAKMTVRDEAVEAGDFVDLSAMILEDDLPVRDTRMKVADEEPTGDEERDFQEMLARFKQGIDENIDEGDFQSHYDLGVAFKEMGLLDEAIAELQKALRAPDGKLRSSEALGVCFLDKGAYVVAESILRRALDLPASGDQERLGVLYWLGRALEEQGKRFEARALYGRVFAVDIRFRDVRERAKALAKAEYRESAGRSGRAARSPTAGGRGARARRRRARADHRGRLSDHRRGERAPGAHEGEAVPPHAAAALEPGGGRHGSTGGDARRGRRVDSPRHPGARRLGRPFGAAAGDADAQCAVLAPGRRDHGRLPVLAGDHRAGPPGRSRAVAGVRPGDERDDDR